MLSRVPALSPTVSSNSALSGVVEEDDDGLDVPLPDIDTGDDFIDKDAHILIPDDTTPLHAFRERFADLRKKPCSDGVWSRFVALVDEMTAEAAVIIKLPVRPEGRASRNRTVVNSEDAKGIQSLYRHNRRMTVRHILSGVGQSCDVVV